MRKLMRFLPLALMAWRYFNKQKRSRGYRQPYRRGY